MQEHATTRPLNVTVLAGSRAQRAYHARAGLSEPGHAPAPGFPLRPSLNLRDFGGKTITDLVFAHHYLGGSAAWDPADMASIDAALAKAMTDNGLQSVIQYFEETITSRMLPSVVLPDPSPSSSPKSTWPTAQAPSRSS